MQAQSKTYLSPEEYLEIERRAEFRSEYFNGEMFAMAGASLAHNRITRDALTAINTSLRSGDCEVFSNDMRVKIDPIKKYAYPDLVAVCGDARFEDAETDTLLNPVLIIEVLSPSTAAYDRGAKFEHYRQIPSLREFVLIEQDRPHIEVYRRDADGSWRLFEQNDLEGTVSLESIGCHLTLREIYARVEFVARTADDGADT